ncbi:MAG: class I SAM-dependent methyltransferase, partial [Planctomycetota bacterium]
MKNTASLCAGAILVGLAAQGWAQQAWSQGVDRSATALFASPAGTAQEIIAASGIKGGLVVHVAAGDDISIADFFLNKGFLVHGLYRSKADVAQARDHIKKKDLYGKVSVQTWDRDYLPYADNMVNLLIAEDIIDISAEEVMRVLVPRGVAYIKSETGWDRTVK